MRTCLTNFSPDERELYEEAVRTSPQKGFYISDKGGFPNNPHQLKDAMSLHHPDPYINASAFWRHFDRLRNARKGTR